MYKRTNPAKKKKIFPLNKFTYEWNTNFHWINTEKKDRNNQLSSLYKNKII